VLTYCALSWLYGFDFIFKNANQNILQNSNQIQFMHIKKNLLRFRVNEKFRFLSIIVLFLTSLICIGQTNRVKNDKILFTDDFENALDTTVWKVEMVKGPDASVSINNGKLVINTPDGVTVWMKKLLTGNIGIEYDWKVIMNGGKNDRLSDLNQFWMANDPHNPNLFTRNGVFEAYDSLQLYYVGMGGNGNTTTRFRKYQGSGQRELLQEYVDQQHLLIPNHTYHIKIIILNGQTSFYVDGQRYFDYHDPSSLKQGYFGFRSTKSHHEIDHYRVYQLTDRQK